MWNKRAWPPLAEVIMCGIIVLWISCGPYLTKPWMEAMNNACRLTSVGGIRALGHYLARFARQLHRNFVFSPLIINPDRWRSGPTHKFMQGTNHAKLRLASSILPNGDGSGNEPLTTEAGALDLPGTQQDARDTQIGHTSFLPTLIDSSKSQKQLVV